MEQLRITFPLKGPYSFYFILAICRGQLICTMKDIILFQLKIITVYSNVIRNDPPPPISAPYNYYFKFNILFYSGFFVLYLLNSIKKLNTGECSG